MNPLTIFWCCKSHTALTRILHKPETRLERVGMKCKNKVIKLDMKNGRTSWKSA